MAIVHVGPAWTGNGPQIDASGYAGQQLRHWAPNAVPLADQLANLVRGLQPGWNRTDLVVRAYDTVRQHFGLGQPEVQMTQLTPTQGRLYNGIIFFPHRQLGLSVDGLDDPRDLVEVGVRLAGMDARMATLVTGLRPNDPGRHRMVETLEGGADDVARPVMAAFNSRLGLETGTELPAPGREL
jgi:hypothetical protein